MDFTTFAAAAAALFIVVPGCGDQTGVEQPRPTAPVESAISNAVDTAAVAARDIPAPTPVVNPRAGISIDHVEVRFERGRDGTGKLRVDAHARKDVETERQRSVEAKLRCRDGAHTLVESRSMSPMLGPDSGAEGDLSSGFLQYGFENYPDACEVEFSWRPNYQTTTPISTVCFDGQRVHAGRCSPAIEPEAIIGATAGEAFTVHDMFMHRPAYDGFVASARVRINRLPWNGEQLIIKQRCADGELMVVNADSMRFYSTPVEVGESVVVADAMQVGARGALRHTPTTCELSVFSRVGERESKLLAQGCYENEGTRRGPCNPEKAGFEASERRPPTTESVAFSGVALNVAPSRTSPGKVDVELRGAATVAHAVTAHWELAADLSCGPTPSHRANDVRMFTTDLEELVAGDSVRFGRMYIENQQNERAFPGDISTCQIDMLARNRRSNDDGRVALASLCFSNGAVSSGACPPGTVSR